jgi:hypothetical protein
LVEPAFLVALWKLGAVYNLEVLGTVLSFFVGLVGGLCNFGGSTKW